MHKAPLFRKVNAPTCPPVSSLDTNTSGVRRRQAVEMQDRTQFMIPKRSNAKPLPWRGTSLVDIVDGLEDGGEENRDSKILLVLPWSAGVRLSR